MPNLNEYLDKLKNTNELLKNATKGIEMMRNAAMSLEDNTKGKYEEDKAENIVKEDDANENALEKVIQQEKVTQQEKVAEKDSVEDILNIDFSQVNLTQAFIYSEIFGKPKSLRRGR